MTNVMDQLGNPLLKGDMVLICEGQCQLYGFVTEITAGGIIAPNVRTAAPAPGQGPVTGLESPATLTIMLIPYTVPFNPRGLTRLPNITKVMKPPHMTAPPQA